MRVIVCGGRDHRNTAFIWRTLDKLHAEHRFTALMQGGEQNGADRIAKEWARTKPELEGQRFESKAQWTRYGKAAGPIRNLHMLEWKPDMVIAFPTLASIGTWNMVRAARAVGLEPLVFE